MLMSDLYPRKYLSGTDVSAPMKATIDKVVIEEVGQTNERKPVLHFREGHKPMILNRTNANTIAQKYGHDSDEWLGAAVVLYTTPVSDPSGKTVEGLRIRFPATKAAAAPVVQSASDLDDLSIPF